MIILPGEGRKKKEGNRWKSYDAEQFYTKTLNCVCEKRGKRFEARINIITEIDKHFSS